MQATQPVGSKWNKTVYLSFLAGLTNQKVDINVTLFLAELLSNFVFIKSKMKSRFQSFYKRTIFAITVRHVISRTGIIAPYKMIAQWLWLFLSDILHANDIMIYSKLDSFKCRYIFKILVSDSTLKVNFIEIISIISDLINKYNV